MMISKNQMRIARVVVKTLIIPSPRLEFQNKYLEFKFRFSGRNSAEQ